MSEDIYSEVEENVMTTLEMGMMPESLRSDRCRLERSQGIKDHDIVSYAPTGV